MGKTNKPRVICAMSGGVDSSVAAAVLKDQGYDVVGIFMKLWSESSDRASGSMKLWAEKSDPADLIRENICCSVEASTAARAVAKQLGIPFYVVNFADEFKKLVVDYYIEEYESGRTPNPCVICNRDIKGELLLKKAGELKAEFLATGHYAKIKNGRMFRAADQDKDQTYFLWTLTAEKAKHILFPCGDYTKPEIRAMAREMALPTAERRESQGLCFIPDRNVSAFLRRYAKNLTEPGPIVDMEGHQIGTHDGLINYTIGQREHLGLGGPNAYYVVKLKVRGNVLVVGEEKDLYQKKLIATNLNFINQADSRWQIADSIGARIRHGHPIEPCKIKLMGETEAEVVFQKPQRAITPGQSIVFYQGEEVLGGGIIQ